MNKENWLQNPNEWQFVDPTNGFIFPWLTLDFLEHLTTLDGSKWRGFEAGSGCGTLWGAKKCEEVVTLESGKGWFDKERRFAEEKSITNVEFNLIEPTDDRDDSIKAYLGVLQRQQQKFDAVIIDGIFRNQLATVSRRHIKDDGLLVVDNYSQKGVESITEYSNTLNAKYPIQVFKQSPILDPENHPWVWNENKEHFFRIKQGHPDWKTAYWKITR